MNYYDGEAGPRTEANSGGGGPAPSLADVRKAREAADAAGQALRQACLDALKANPLRQVAIAAGKNRQTIYNWAEEARRG